jgi:hypothetical protein
LLGIGDAQAQNMILHLQEMIPAQLIKNLQGYGGGDQLVAKVKQCLERQQQIILGQ